MTITKEKTWLFKNLIYQNVFIFKYEFYFQ